MNTSTIHLILNENENDTHTNRKRYFRLRERYIGMTFQGDISQLPIIFKGMELEKN